MSEYLVWRPEAGQTKNDAAHIDAHSHRSAAEAWAQRYDTAGADYSIARGMGAEVLVAECEEGAAEKRFAVSGECVPEYRARMVA